MKKKVWLFFTKNEICWQKMNAADLSLFFSDPQNKWEKEITTDRRTTLKILLINSSTPPLSTLPPPEDEPHLKNTFKNQQLPKKKSPGQSPVLLQPNPLGRNQMISPAVSSSATKATLNRANVNNLPSSSVKYQKIQHWPSSAVRRNQFSSERIWFTRMSTTEETNRRIAELLRSSNEVNYFDRELSKIFKALIPEVIKAKSIK